MIGLLPFNLSNIIFKFRSDLLNRRIEKSVMPFTMTSSKRIKALLWAVTYLNENKIKGDIVECGVWKGGSLMAIIEKLIFHGDLDRTIWAFDTFEGMTEPEDHDVDLNNNKANLLLDKKKYPEIDIKCVSNFDETTTNILGKGYPNEKLQFIKGDVANTLPNIEIDNIALLHLDTDWYASTKIELEFLYPKIIKGGVMIIDDYGHWQGCKKAVDEYFAIHKIPINMIEVDYTARLIIKQ
jgi:O-methyltransferase